MFRFTVEHFFAAERLFNSIQSNSIQWTWIHPLSGMLRSPTNTFLSPSIGNIRQELIEAFAVDVKPIHNNFNSDL